jgi:hypothetical protein
MPISTHFTLLEMVQLKALSLPHGHMEELKELEEVLFSLISQICRIAILILERL